MANPNVLDDSTNEGSGRFRLPSRLRNANFKTTVLAALAALAADTPVVVTGPVAFKKYTTTQRNTLATGWTATQKGYVVYDSTLDCLVMWDGAAWKTPDGGTPA